MPWMPENFLESLFPQGVSLITLHWTVGTYDQVFDGDYHFQIVGEGRIWVDDHAFDSHGNFLPLAHAWRHNTANVGISICGMYDAVEPSLWTPKSLYDFPSSYGQYPPTKEQMDSMCQLTASLVRKYSLTFDKIKTHYELSLEDGYPGERWEYKFEKPYIVKEVQRIYEETKPSAV